MIDSISCSIDSLSMHKYFFFTESLVKYCICDTSFISSITLGDVIACISFVGSVIVFCFKTKSNIREQNKLLKRKWILDVIITPNISSINKLYLDIHDDVCNDLRELNSDYNKDGIAKDIEDKKRKMKRKFKNKINHVFEPFSVIISSCDQTLGEKVIEIMEELEDNSTKIIDEYLIYNESDYDIDLFFNKSKQKLHTILYKGYAA